MPFYTFKNRSAFGATGGSLNDHSLFPTALKWSARKLNVDFYFSPIGDIFSCHAVDNPKPHSELKMLRQYGPNVPEPILQKLVAAFGELRSLADQGIINYPYSTREVVNIVKHLQVWHTPVHGGLKEAIDLVFLDHLIYSKSFNFYIYNTDSDDIIGSVCNLNIKSGRPIDI